MELANLLIDLPTRVTRPILKEWLGLRDVVRVDTSFRNKILRSSYLELAYQSGAVYDVRSYLKYRGCAFEKVVRWSGLRGAKVNILQCTTAVQMKYDALSRFLQTSGDSVQTIYFQTTPRIQDSIKAADAITKLCINVSHFECISTKLRKLHDHPWDANIVPLTESNSRLHTLLLQNLGFSANEVEKTLGNCQALVRLTLVRCGVVLPVQVAIPTLVELDISANKIPATTLVAIAANCKVLRTLYVFLQLQCGKGLNGAVQAILKGCPALQETDVDQAADVHYDLRMQLVHRRGAEGMQSLNLHEWRGVSDPLVRRLLAECPAIKSLTTGSYKLSDATLAAWAPHTQNLQDVSVVRSPLTTGAGVAGLFRPDSRLHRIHIVGCPAVDGSALAGLGRHCPQLANVYVSQCGAVTAEQLSMLVRPGSTLTEIVITDCPPITEEAVPVFAGRCPLLRTLELPKGSVATDRSYLALAQYCPDLVQLRGVTGPEISDQAVTALAKGCPRLERLDVGRSRLLTMQSIHALREHSRMHDILLPRTIDVRNYDIPNFDTVKYRYTAEDVAELERRRAERRAEAKQQRQEQRRLGLPVSDSESGSESDYYYDCTESEGEVGDTAVAASAEEEARALVNGDQGGVFSEPVCEPARSAAVVDAELEEGEVRETGPPVFTTTADPSASAVQLSGTAAKNPNKSKHTGQLPVKARRQEKKTLPARKSRSDGRV
jgi:hypothetical protein